MKMRLCLLALCAVLPALGGCERWLRNMYDQPRLDPGEASPLFADGKASRPPPPGSVVHAMGDVAATSSGRRGEEPVQRLTAAEAASAPPPVTMQLLQRGRERFDIYCMPCHSPVGDGDGPITRRGFPHPPSYHSERLRNAPDRHFYDVMTQGYGIMVPYADRLTPEDRWAVVAYIRALQLSQHAPVDRLPPALQTALRTQPPTAPPGPARQEAGG
jgi:mono/diheme cytochrome c family protein